MIDRNDEAKRCSPACQCVKCKCGDDCRCARKD
jgi:hypothetical protein